jgi:IclR family transcriptional regulator, KDG regulon repressor
MKTGTTETGGVLVLHKTLDILENIRSYSSNDKPAGVKLSDLARAVDMPKATVYRILSTLESRGFLDRSEDGGYRIARKLFDLQPRHPIEQILNRVAPPKMEELAKSCRETVNLGILDGGEVVVVNTVESPQTIRMSSKIGNRRCLHTTAIGKVLLAALPEKEMLRLIRLKGLPRLTPYTIVNRTALITEIDRVRERGYAIDNQENELDGRCIGAPIAGPDGRVVAALSISGPVFRMDLNRARSLAPKLKQACAAISAAARG